MLGFVWSKQKEICESVVTNRYTAVKSCHSVGKTAIAARLGCWFLSSHPPGDAFLVTSAPTGQQVRALLWREINALHALGGLPGRTNATEWLFDNELVGFGRSVRDMNPTAFQGIHARYVLVILDEACGITFPIWTAAETLVANDDSRFLAIGNPDDPATAFGDACRPGSGYNVIQISAYDSPNFTDERCPEWLSKQLVGEKWVEERRVRWTEDSPLWLSKVMGDFPEQSEDGLVPIKDVRAAVERELVAEGPIELGVDVARFGLDRTVIYKRQGPVARKVKTLTKRDTMTVVWAVVDAIEETKAEIVKIDDIGLGGGVVDRLNELYIDGRFTAKIVGINVGEKPHTQAANEKFYNLRADLNWGMRERFMDGDIDIEDDDDLLAQATAMKYEHTPRGQILMQSKKKTKKLRMPSPDDWDALVLAFTPESYGADMAFTEQSENFIYEPFSFPKFWPRVYGIDINGPEVSVVWGVFDIETGTIYLYEEYISKRPDISINASAIRKRRAWIPGLFDMRDHGRSKEQAERLTWALMEEHLNIFELEADQESAAMEITARLMNQSLKVSSKMGNWMNQYRSLKRDQEGLLVQEKDGLLRSTGLIMLGGEGIATTRELLEANPEDATLDTIRDETTGY